MAAIAMSGLVSLVGSLAMIGIVLVALVLMMGAQQPGDALKNVGLVLGIAVLLIMVPQLAASVWRELPIWQKLFLVMGCLIVWLPGRGVRQPRKRRRE